MTGAAGFLASHLVEQLLQQSWTVHALHRNGTDTTLLRKFAANSPTGQLHLVTGDITDYDSLLRAVPQDVAVVFHVAALVAPWFGANDNMYAVNVLGTPAARLAADVVRPTRRRDQARATWRTSVSRGTCRSSCTRRATPCSPDRAATTPSPAPN